MKSLNFLNGFSPFTVGSFQFIHVFCMVVAVQIMTQDLRCGGAP